MPVRVYVARRTYQKHSVILVHFSKIQLEINFQSNCNAGTIICNKKVIKVNESVPLGGVGVGGVYL